MVLDELSTASVCHLRTPQTTPRPLISLVTNITHIHDKITIDVPKLEYLRVCICSSWSLDKTTVLK